MKTLKQHIDLYRKTHEANPTWWTGVSLDRWIPEIGQLIQAGNIKTVLDVGCGKILLPEYKEKVKDFWGDVEITLYDPAVAAHSKKPDEEEFDLVVCTDVIEHIPEELLDDFLLDLTFYSLKAIFITVCLSPAKKTLINGENAHATIRPREWWDETFDHHFIQKYVAIRYT